MTPSERKRFFRDNRRCKLTEKDIKAIRMLWKKGTKQKLIAPQFDITPGYVSRILSGDVWAHI